ncbi:hypothetical protein CSB45_13750 [candidate division KSB3 bacterium]|uniref:Peptidase M16 n=1 Tax=candidate division KSB3 bacterium TaxID=2044937 RepID=A0A2G6E1G0_9BACT|nr:MAG: hypothetical protein CSB45_13750 [candidate division KSB3 bacterium]PIE28528.1 MAG: hypothetical protein CSA57_13570 [candidate division KSB3 bacterium]
MTFPQLDIQSRVLDNGLSVLILEKHDISVVSSSIWYHVGSAHEREGQTGISHFLEHLLFKGTPSYGKGAIDLLTATHGGNSNAGTIFDYTMYYFNFCSDRWELALELEADRMRNCLFDPQEFEAERQVVLEELKQGNDSPWGMLSREVERLIFPDHPYQHPVIGWQEDLEALTREDVLEYYHHYYVPNNATIIVVGDVKADRAVDLVARHFAHIPAGDEIPTLQAALQEQEAEQRVTIAQESHLTRLQIGYRGCSLADDDCYALDVLDHLLSHGKTSRLYQRLVEKEQAVNFISTYNHLRRLSGVLYVSAALRPGVEGDLVEQMIDEELDRIQHDTILEEEVQKARNVISADFMFGKETASGLAHFLGECDVLHSYKFLHHYVERIEAVSADDVQQAAQKYLKKTCRTVGWAIPKGTGPEQGEERYEEPLLAPSTDSMVFHRSSAVSLNTRTHGKPGTSAVKSSPISFNNRHHCNHHRRLMDNGLTVLFLERHDLPILSIDAFVEAGQRYERDALAGVAVLTGELLDEGTQSRTAFEIASAIESIGGFLESHSQGASIQVLSRDAPLAMSLLSDILRFPRFDADMLEKKRALLLASIEGDRDNPSLTAYNLFREMVYGSHPYHRPRKGYKERVAALRREDILQHYHAFFCPNNTILAIVGDAEPEKIFDAVERCFATWESQEVPELPDVTIPEAHGCIRRHLERDKEQVHVYLGHLGVTRNNPDFYRLFTMDHILGLGSGFTDRISRRLRDEQGLAYAVSANISLTAEQEPGCFTAYIGTSPENVEQAIGGFLGEIRRIRDEPVSEEELELAKNYICGSYVFNFETCAQLTRYLVNIERYHLGDAFIRDFPEIVQEVSIEDIQQAARDYLDPDNYYIASAGKTHRAP